MTANEKLTVGNLLLGHVALAVCITITLQVAYNNKIPLDPLRPILVTIAIIIVIISTIFYLSKYNDKRYFNHEQRQ